MKTGSLLPQDVVGSESIEFETYIPTTTYIVILCFGLLVISIILEIIKIKMMRQRIERIKREVIDFIIVLMISLIGTIFCIKKIGLTKIRGIEHFCGSIWYIILSIILVISIIMVVRPLIYIIKQRRRKDD